MPLFGIGPAVMFVVDSFMWISRDFCVVFACGQRNAVSLPSQLLLQRGRSARRTDVHGD